MLAFARRKSRSPSRVGVRDFAKLAPKVTSIVALPRYSPLDSFDEEKLLAREFPGNPEHCRKDDGLAHRLS
jgi:hypothetical protein